MLKVKVIRINLSHVELIDFQVFDKGEVTGQFRITERDPEQFNKYKIDQELNLKITDLDKGLGIIKEIYPTEVQELSIVEAPKSKSKK